MRPSCSQRSLALLPCLASLPSVLERLLRWLPLLLLPMLAPLLLPLMLRLRLLILQPRWQRLLLPWAAMGPMTACRC